jgi:hypothetical protein
MALGFGVASASPTIAVAALLAAVGTVGNGVAIVCNQVLVQRGAPDAMRGRALAVLMSVYYAVLGLSMAGGGLLVDAAGARAAWAFAGCVYAAAAVAALVLTRGIREAAETAPTGAGVAMERIRALMDEIDETRRREQQLARAGVTTAVARDAEGRPTT